MFKPINPPPSDHHSFSVGLSTEFGDTAKTVAEKVNAGFEHVYKMLRGMGASMADEVEYVAKSEFDALVHELDEAKAELNNIKMMVQGYATAKAPEPKISSITATMDGKLVDTDQIPAGTPINVTVGMAPEALDPEGQPATGGNPTPSEPVVTVSEAAES